MSTPGEKLIELAKLLEAHAIRQRQLQATDRIKELIAKIGNQRVLEDIAAGVLEERPYFKELRATLKKEGFNFR